MYPIQDIIRRQQETHTEFERWAEREKVLQCVKEQDVVMSRCQAVHSSPARVFAKLVQIGTALLK